MANTKTYEEKVQTLEAQGLCRSDAQAVVDAQEQKRIRANANRQARNETVLYGLPKGAKERYEEVLLLTNGNAAKIERVKILAAHDGFHSFRVAEIDLNVPPDFSKSIL